MRIIPIIFTTYGYMAFYKHFDGYLFSQLIVLIKPRLKSTVTTKLLLTPLLTRTAEC